MASYVFQMWNGGEEGGGGLSAVRFLNKWSQTLLCWDFCLLVLSVTEKIEISDYNCGFVYFSLQFFPFSP